MRNDYQVTRKNIEALILSCFLNQNRTLPLDEIEFKDYKLPYEIFKGNKTNKIIAKAIHNLQEKKQPINDEIILDYIQERMTINPNDYFEVSNYTWCTFDTAVDYIERLKVIDADEIKLSLLRGL